MFYANVIITTADLIQQTEQKSDLASSADLYNKPEHIFSLLYLIAYYNNTDLQDGSI